MAYSSRTAEMAKPSSTAEVVNRNLRNQYCAACRGSATSLAMENMVSEAKYVNVNANETHWSFGFGSPRSSLKAVSRRCANKPMTKIIGRARTAILPAKAEVKRPGIVLSMLATNMKRKAVRHGRRRSKIMKAVDL